MTKAHLNFPARPKSYLPRVNSRRMGLAAHLFNAAYKSDGDTATADADADVDPETEKLLAGVQARVAKEIEKRGFVKNDDVAKLVTESLKGMNLDAIRNFDPSKLSNDVLKLAGEVKRIQALPKGADGMQERMAAIKALLHDEGTMKLIERAFKVKDSTGAASFTINTRAAVAVMTTGNVVNDGDIPEDILNNFRVDAFITKRRPEEFIFNIVNRNTEADLPEYITWEEEGDIEGGFAIVAEGAVKPLMSGTLVRQTSKYKKLAAKRVYTEEFAKFRKEAYRILEGLFNDKLVRDYAQLLVVDLNAKAASYVGTVLDDQYTTPTDYHAIGAVAAQIEALNFVPDLIVLNPQDKWRIGLSQTQPGGQFLVNIPVYNPSGTVTLMGFQVVTSNNCPAGTFYLGERGLFKVIDEPVQVRLGYGINVQTAVVSGTTVVTAVDSDVDTNRFRIIAETYYHSYIGSSHIGSFVKATFAGVKAALLAP